MAGGWQPSNRRQKPKPPPEESPPPRPSRRRKPPAAADKTAPSSEPLASSPPIPEGLEDREPKARNVPPGGKWGKEDPRTNGYLVIRLGKRWTQVISEVKAGEYTWTQFCEGLDNEELARGQLRAENGRFIGRPPKFVPREFSQYAFRELSERFQVAMKEEVMRATREYLAIAQDPEVDVKTRAKMLEHIMARVFGPIPKEVNIKQEAPWETVFTRVVRGKDNEVPDWRKEREARYAARLAGEEEDDGEDS